MTPTNLTQMLSFESDNKYRDLSKYLYQQQSLYLSKKLTSGQYRTNIVSGFKRVFYNARYIPYYNHNSDLCLHSTQLAIQATGRICRCKNKNKKIYIYSDTELLSRIHEVKDQLSGRIFNAEFSEYMETKINTRPVSSIENYSKQNKSAYINIRNNAYTVRSSRNKVLEWQDLRDYVLRNPTTGYADDRYANLYFRFDTPTRGYSYKKDNRHNFVELILDTRTGNNQVSMNHCELPMLLAIPCIDDCFTKNNYMKIWKAEKFVMSESLFSQVYLGALGEVVGKAIIESKTGWEYDPIEDYSLYEYFDFKIRNKIYVDFKNWKTFQANPEAQIKKIKWKLNRAKGAKALIINIIKRGNHDVKMSRDEDIITIPYLINPQTGDVDSEMIEKIEEVINYEIFASLPISSS